MIDGDREEAFHPERIYRLRVFCRNHFFLATKEKNNESIHMQQKLDRNRADTHSLSTWVLLVTNVSMQRSWTVG